MCGIQIILSFTHQTLIEYLDTSGTLQDIWNTKMQTTTLARWLTCLECHSIHKKIADLIPGQNEYLGCGFNPQSERIQKAMGQCSSLSLSNQ